MATIKLTQSEAERLISMLKKSLDDEVRFPSKREKIEFNVVGDLKSDVFTISIFRGNINRLRYNFGARITKNGILLLELHINPSSAHLNPDGEKISGSHWHIYSEKYGRAEAFPADNIDSEKFVENTITFLDRFNVIEKPNVTAQFEFA